MGALGTEWESFLQPKRGATPRLVSKDGRCLLQQFDSRNRRITSCRLLISRNWFHLTIECSWQYILCLFVGSFLLSWLIFGSLYYVIILFYDESQLQGTSNQCIANVRSFVAAFLFSLESQHTIGYGSRYITEACPLAYIVLCLQLIFGVYLQTVVTGIVIAKVLLPKGRSQEMRFSRLAVIGPFEEGDKRPTLMIRLADIRHKLCLAEPHVRLYMVCSSVNKNGQRELIGIKDVNVGYDNGWDRVLLLWPITVRHVIDKDSPLFGLTKETLPYADFELIMTVEGVVETTGMTFQARTSFLPSEILWGHRFVPMVLLNNESNEYEIHYSLFDRTVRLSEFVPETGEADELRPPLPPRRNASGFL